MPTDKLQILTPIVTSVNGQTGDVVLNIARVPSDEEILVALQELNIIEPTVNSDGAIYIDKDNNVYSL